MREFIKQRGFKWKNLTNEEGGVRYSVNEINNTEYTNQMRKSKAHVFRRGMNKEDLLREPISLYFGTMSAYGVPKEQINIQKFSENPNINELQSQANVIQNMYLLNMKLNSNDKNENQTTLEMLPKLSEIKQDSNEGY
jgi:hypothetical protein